MVVGVIGDGRAADHGIDFAQCLPQIIGGGMAIEEDGAIGGDEDHGGKGLHTQFALE